MRQQTPSLFVTVADFLRKMGDRTIPITWSPFQNIRNPATRKPSAHTIKYIFLSFYNCNAHILPYHIPGTSFSPYWGTNCEHFSVTTSKKIHMLAKIHVLHIFCKQINIIAYTYITYQNSRSHTSIRYLWPHLVSRDGKLISSELSWT